MAISFLTSITGAMNDADSQTVVETSSIAPGAGSDRILIAFLAAGTAAEVSNIKWGGSGGTSMTLIGSALTSTYIKTWLYYLLDADIGSAAKTLYLQIDVAGSYMAVGGAVFTGVDQATPLGTMVSVDDTTSPVTSPTITSASDEMIVDGIDCAHGSGTPSITKDAAQTLIWSVNSDTRDGSTGMSYKAGSASTTMSWTAFPEATYGGHIMAVPLKPAAGGGPAAPSLRFVRGNIRLN